MTRRRCVEKQRVLCIRRRVGERGKGVQLLDEAIDITVAIERRTRPGGLEVAPLRQVPGRPLQTVDRRVLARGGAESLPDRSPQRAADAFGRILQLRLD